VADTGARFYVLGLDPGFANMGVALVRLEPDALTLVRLANIQTEKAAAKRGTFASDDSLYRGKLIAGELRKLVRLHVNGPRPGEPDAPVGKLVAVCAESMSFPRNAGNSQKMGIAWGIIAALVQDWDVPVVQCSPQSLKKRLTDSKTASKEDIQAAMVKRFGDVAMTTGLRGIPQGQYEHPCDALGAIVACEQSPELTLARRFA
jgi:Holliday junction resolvasome RuvABC endonuclease subunit